MSKYPKVKFGDFVEHIVREVELEADKEYPSVGVKWYGEGVHVHEVKSGGSFNASRFEIKANDIIYNDMWARNGSVAIVPSHLDGAVASSHFPTFLPDLTRVLPKYLEFYFKTRTFWDDCENASRGSTGRNQIKKSTFYAIEIPLPSIAEQRRIVAHIEALAAQVNAAQRLRGEVEKDIKRMLLAAFLRISSNAPRLPMTEIAPLVRRAVKVDFDKDYLELGVRSFGKGTFHKPALNGADVGTKKLFYIEPGDLIFSNVFAWEGGIAVANPRDVGRVGSHRFITCVPKANVATARYLCFYFLTQEGLEKIGLASPGGAGRNRTLGLNALANIEVPVPDYDKQLWFDDLLDKVNELRELQSMSGEELSALMPSILDKAFREEL